MLGPWVPELDRLDPTMDHDPLLRRAGEPMTGALRVLPNAGDETLQRLALEQRANWRVDRLLTALLGVVPPNFAPTKDRR